MRNVLTRRPTSALRVAFAGADHLPIDAVADVLENVGVQEGDNVATGLDPRHALAHDPRQVAVGLDQGEELIVSGHQLLGQTPGMPGVQELT